MNDKVMYAKDYVFSRASKLPRNLLLDTASEAGVFATDFLFRLTDEQLLILKAESEKKKKEDVFFSFATTTANSSACPMELKTFSNFDWKNVLEIRISGDTCPFQKYAQAEPEYYISVVFVLKD